MVDLADFRAIANRIFVLLNQASLQGRGSRRLDVDCSTGRRPMERADEPPPPILGTFRIWPWQGQKFGSTAPQATKFYHVELLITKWFRHWKKICVTSVTFRRFWRLRDALLPNWMKYYGGWMGKRKGRDEACGCEARGSLVDHVNDSASDSVRK